MREYTTGAGYFKDRTNLPICYETSPSTKTSTNTKINNISSKNKKDFGAAHSKHRFKANADNPMLELGTRIRTRTNRVGQDQSTASPLTSIVKVPAGIPDGIAIPNTETKNVHVIYSCPNYATHS